MDKNESIDRQQQPLSSAADDNQKYDNDNDKDDSASSAQPDVNNSSNDR
jgi:hypothetical protein